MKYIAKGTAFGMDCQGDAMDSPERARNSLIGLVAITFDIEPIDALALLVAGGPIVASLMPEVLPLIEVEERGTGRICELIDKGLRGFSNYVQYSVLLNAWGAEVARACL
jgi:hypothetical protein